MKSDHRNIFKASECRNQQVRDEYFFMHHLRRYPVQNIT